VTYLRAPGTQLSAWSSDIDANDQINGYRLATTWRSSVV